MNPLLVWSWRTLPGPALWPTAARLRALAIGHAIATRAGYRVVFYGDTAALRELDSLPWPWERRALPEGGADRVPDGFWSGSKLTALRDARDREPDGVAVVHVDHDAIVSGPLPQLDAPLYAQNTEHFPHHPRVYPDFSAAFGDALPPWWQDWRASGRTHECGLVGGASRYAVDVYVDEALRCAGLLDRRGTLERVHTWTLEQGVHAAIATEMGARVGFALDEQHRGQHYAAWPGTAKRHMPLGRLEPALPRDLRAALAAKLGPLVPASRVLSPFGAL